jgi:predicted O-methyltransferase YrrM
MRDVVIMGPGPAGVRGGGFWEDRSALGAVACTDREAYLLYLAARELRAVDILEVGAYVGWSTAHLAAGAHFPPVVTIENFREHGGSLKEPDSRIRARFEQNLAACGLRDQVLLLEGDFPSVIPPGQYDLAFLDGWHKDGAPLRDVKALAPMMRRHGVLAVHDCWIPDVQAAVNWLLGQGWSMVAFATPGMLCFFYREEPSRWGEFVKEAQRWS